MGLPFARDIVTPSKQGETSNGERMRARVAPSGNALTQIREKRTR
jgi:hypothetical protein